LQLVLIDHPAEVAEAGYRFWRGAVGSGEPEEAADSEYRTIGEIVPGLWLEHQRIGGDAARIHLDIETDDVEAEVARLEALGAVRVAQVESWWQMRDPAGLVFCVVPIQSDEFARHATTWSD
jgi:hypothetical protein